MSCRSHEILLKDSSPSASSRQLQSQRQKAVASGRCIESRLNGSMDSCSAWYLGTRPITRFDHGVSRGAAELTSSVSTSAILGQVLPVFHNHCTTSNEGVPIMNALALLAHTSPEFVLGFRQVEATVVFHFAGSYSQSYRIGGLQLRRLECSQKTQRRSEEKLDWSLPLPPPRIPMQRQPSRSAQCSEALLESMQKRQ